MLDHNATEEGVMVRIPKETAIALRNATSESVTAKDLSAAGLAVLKAVREQAVEYYYGEEDFTITVRKLDGKVITLKVNRRTTVQSAKFMIMRNDYIPPDQQTLVVMGKTMCDDASLGDYPVAPDSVVHLLVRLRGS